MLCDINESIRMSVIAKDFIVTWSVCLSVCHGRAPRWSRWTEWEAVWRRGHSCDLQWHYFKHEPRSSHGRRNLDKICMSQNKTCGVQRWRLLPNGFAFPVIILVTAHGITTNEWERKRLASVDDFA